MLHHEDRCFSARIVFAHLQPGQTQVLKHPRRLWGQLVSIAALRLNDGELLGREE
jgi:hypothetical protein